MATYTVVTPVLFDKLYAPGSGIELTEGQAAPLLAGKSIKVPSPEAAPVVAALGATTLGKLNLTELTTYAQLHGVAIDPAWSKDELLKMVTAVTGNS